MHPLLFSFGQIHVYWLSILTVVSWLVFSFIFWRNLRRIGIGDDVIFDLTFYATIAALIAARVGFIAFHWEIFSSKSPLLAVALWVAPGLSWTGAFIGGVSTLVALSRLYKVRLGQVLDSMVSALPCSFIIGAVGTLLDGAQQGKVSVSGLRHPVELYQIIGMVILYGVFMRVNVQGERNKWPYGIVSIWFIFSYALVMFLIEFVSDTHVYFGNITANQWVYLALIAECIGVLYVRGGGREKIRPLFRLFLSKLKKIGDQSYAKISKRRS